MSNSAIAPLTNLPHCHQMRSARTVGKATGFKLRFQQRMQDIEQSLLNDAIAHGWNTQFASTPIPLRHDNLAQWQRPIPIFSNGLAEMGKMANCTFHASIHPCFGEIRRWMCAIAGMIGAFRASTHPTLGWGRSRENNLKIYTWIKQRWELCDRSIMSLAAALY
jgi:hypothetical protein